MTDELKYNDKQHAYWWNGTRTKGVTSVAGILDDKYALDKWRTRMVAVGMATTPELVERAAAHYDEKDLLNEIAEEALQAARANVASARGSAAHRITERVDLEQMVVDTPYARQVQAAWAKALADAGLEILPQYVERIVVYPDLPLAGTFDRIARRKFDGTLVVVDLKTGARAVEYPHSMAIQLALYANAPLLAGPIPPGGGTTNEFVPMPKVSRKVGYVIHMPEGDETVEVRPINIEAGWQAAESLVFPTLEWRKRRDLVGAPITAASVTPLTDNIRARLGILKMVDGARELVIRHWPVDCPPKPPWSDEQGKAIVAVLSRVELDVGAPF